MAILHLIIASPALMAFAWIPELLNDVVKATLSLLALLSRIIFV